MIRASAPGKLMVAGEYAVLRSRRAVVTAVDRRVRLEFRDEDHDVERLPRTLTDLPPEVQATRELAEEAVGSVTGAMLLDVSDLRMEGRKLGLGSSSAAAAATAAVVFAAAGKDNPSQGQLLDVAFRGHRSVAPHGSGADVAAAVLGGWVELGGVSESGELMAEAIAWPAVEMRIVWTGVEARTSEFVSRVRALERENPSVYRSRLDAIEAAAETMGSAAAAGDVGSLVRAVRDHHAAMATLGEAIEAPIVEATLDAIATLAEECGGGAKPSGAGGGDVAIAFLPDADAARRFVDRAEDSGFRVLTLELGAEGARVDARA